MSQVLLPEVVYAMKPSYHHWSMAWPNPSPTPQRHTSAPTWRFWAITLRYNLTRVSSKPPQRKFKQKSWIQKKMPGSSPHKNPLPVASVKFPFFATKSFPSPNQTYIPQNKNTRKTSHNPSPIFPIQKLKILKHPNQNHPPPPTCPPM